MAQKGITLLCAVFVFAALTIPVRTFAVAQQTFTIEANSPILKVKPGGSAVKNIVIYGTGATDMQITNIVFENGRELFRLGNELPAKATLDPTTGKLKAEVPLIVTLHPEILRDAEYHFTVIATSGKSTAQTESDVLVSVLTTEKPDDVMLNNMISIMYIVVAAGGVVSIIVYKKIASKRSI
jgi:hypothetical protein